MIAKIIALSLLVLLVIIVQLYPYGEELGSEPSIVIALGFIMLAGHLIGELVSKIALPRVTGYLFSGMALGPYLGGLISHESVDHLYLIDNIALALIALSAGGELHLSSLKKIWRGLVYLTICQSIGLCVLVGGAFYYLSSMLPFSQEISQSALILVSILFGFVAVSQSPAVAMAIIAETKIKGITTELCLGVAIIIDIFVIIGFTVGLSSLLALEIGANDVGMGKVLIIGGEILFSILMGVIAGWIFTFYLKYIKQNPFLFLLAFCYLVSESAHSIHLDPVIVCVTAGIWVTNASKRAEELIKTIGSGSLIVYVIFFSVSGASLNLSALSQMWMVGLLLVIARIVIMFMTTQIALKLSNLSVPDPKTFWMVFLPQAGVSLGLVAMLSKHQFSWSDEIVTLMIAYIAINQMIGPIPTKIAFQRAHKYENDQGKLSPDLPK